MKGMFFLKKLTRFQSSKDDKRMQSTDLIETYAYGKSKDLICKKEKIKRNNIIKQRKKVQL